MEYFFLLFSMVGLMLIENVFFFGKCSLVGEVVFGFRYVLLKSWIVYLLLFVLLEVVYV